MNKKIFSFILMAALFAAVLSSCKKDDTQTFVVTFDSKGGTPTPSTQMVKEGGMLEKPADPTLTNYRFTGWTTTDDETSSLWNFVNGTITADMTLYAKWEQNIVAILIEGDGTVSTSVKPLDGGYYVTLTATANNGYRFTEWQEIEGDIAVSSITGNPITFLTYEAFEVKAIFVQAEWYNVTVLSDENGTASSSVASTAEGELVKLTATANSGYSFAEWQVFKGDIYLNKITVNPATFYMPNGDVEVKAIFAPFVGLLESIVISDNSNNYYDRGKSVYEYDSQNRIAKCIIYRLASNDVLYFDSEHIFEYNADGDLVTYNVYGYYGAPHTTFTTNGNKITFYRSHKITQQVGITENGELELNDQGFPVRLISTSETDHSSYGTSTTFYTYSITWQNGNLTKTDWELTRTGYEGEYIGSSNGTKTYTHDDKKTLFYHCNTPKWFLWWLDYYDKYDYGAYNENYGYNENNIKTETKEDGSTTTYEYTYNDDGFPVLRTWNNGTTTLTETYTYK